MGRLLLALLGFLAVIFSLTLLASTSFQVVATLYALALLTLFFRNNPAEGYWLLGGITVGLELLGTSHPGEASLVSLIVVGSHLLFGEQLRFTAPLVRFVAALLVVFISYDLIILSWRHAIGYLFPLFITYLLICLGTWLLTTFRHTPHHEFI
ncbi:MAG: hypothetical protein WCO52_05700 [bacterium]